MHVSPTTVGTASTWPRATSMSGWASSARSYQPSLDIFFVQFLTHFLNATACAVRHAPPSAHGLMLIGACNPICCARYSRGSGLWHRRCAADLHDLGHGVRDVQPRAQAHAATVVQRRRHHVAQPCFARNIHQPPVPQCRIAWSTSRGLIIRADLAVLCPNLGAAGSGSRSSRSWPRSAPCLPSSPTARSRRLTCSCLRPS